MYIRHTNIAVMAELQCPLRMTQTANILLPVETITVATITRLVEVYVTIYGLDVSLRIFLKSMSKSLVMSVSGISRQEMRQHSSTQV